MGQLLGFIVFMFSFYLGFFTSQPLKCDPPFLTSEGAWGEHSRDMSRLQGSAFLACALSMLELDELTPITCLMLAILHSRQENITFTSKALYEVRLL